MKVPQRFVVTVDGIEHAVIVEHAAEATAVRVTIGERAFEVEAGPAGASLVRELGASTQHRVQLDGAPAPAQAHAAGRTFSLHTQSARQAAAQAVLRAAGADAGDDAVVKAPMPGRVVRVLVTAGEAVEVDAPLVIVEAMKMENEVRAPGAGRVRSVAVTAGQTVERGQILCELEAQPVA